MKNDRNLPSEQGNPMSVEVNRRMNRNKSKVLLRAMKAYGNGGIAPRILDFGTR